jgi:hypothetical protein
MSLHRKPLQRVLSLVRARLLGLTVVDHFGLGELRRFPGGDLWR